MITTVLRATVIAQILVGLALGVALALLGVSAWIAIVIAALVPVAFHAVPLFVEFVVGALFDRRPVPRLGPIEFARLWCGETTRSLRSFSIDQPWCADFPEPTLRHDPTRPAILLIHGYVCNRGVWRPWLASGIADRINVATLTLDQAFASIDSYASPIAEAVERLRAGSGRDTVTLVCHSMGGLAARAYLRSCGHASVERVITINTPHHGTVFAPFGSGENTRQMRRACEYIERLASVAEPVEFVCFASQHDNLIVPRDSQVLAGARTIWFERIGHLAMTGSDDVLAKVIEVVGAARDSAQPS